MRRLPALPLRLLAVTGALALAAGCSSGERAAGPSPAAGTAEPTTAPVTEGAAATSSPPGADQTQVATDSLPTGPGGPAKGGDGTQLAVGVTVTRVAQEGDTVTADGYVIGVTEDGGTCTLTLTSGSTKEQVTKPGVADASTTSCAGLEIDRDQLSAGRWQAVLSYSSPRALGAADAVSLEVK